jgi:arginyl-tRNA synthetase
VQLVEGDIVGESFYNDQLQTIVDELRAKGILSVDDGAECVFPPGFTNRNGGPLPLIVRKSDGGFGYAATDLAAIKDRVQRLDADRIFYIVGAPQAMHLDMCIAVAKMAGWLTETVHIEHVAFGSVLDDQRKMFRTRKGQSVKLIELLDEAVLRARTAMASRSADFSEAELDVIANAIGIGAIKYADLSNDRGKDYVFSFDRMLAFEGDTGPYVQYAHARICSVFRKSEKADRDLGVISLDAKEERALGRLLLEYGTVLNEAVATSAPSKLASYVFRVASAFTTFYEGCPILSADVETRRSRLRLCQLSRDILADGLSQLGIDAPDRM